MFWTGFTNDGCVLVPKMMIDTVVRHSCSALLFGTHDRHSCSALGQMTFIPSHTSGFLQPNREDGFSFYMSTNGERFNKSHLTRTCGALGPGQTFGQMGENDNFTHMPDFRENEDENQNSGTWVL